DDADRDRDRQQGEEGDGGGAAAARALLRSPRPGPLRLLAHRREVARGGVGAVAAPGGAVDAVALLGVHRRPALLTGLVTAGRVGLAGRERPLRGLGAHLRGLDAPRFSLP